MERSAAVERLMMLSADIKNLEATTGQKQGSDQSHIYLCPKEKHKHGKKYTDIHTDIYVCQCMYKRTMEGCIDIWIHWLPLGRTR